MLRLLGLQICEAAPMGEQRHEDELGERARMHAARRGDEHVRALEAERLDALADAGRGRLHPFEALRQRRVLALARQVEQDVGAGERLAPAPLLVVIAREGLLADMVGDIAGRRPQIGLADDLELLRRDGADALDMLGLERGGDEDAKLGHRCFFLKSRQDGRRRGARLRSNLRAVSCGRCRLRAGSADGRRSL